MRSKSALSGVVASLTRTVRVGAGPFGPGHLGELTAIVPFELVDAVLGETVRVVGRVRVLPLRVGVYFLLAMGLFPEVGYVGVWGKLTRQVPAVAVSAKALRDLRRRVPVAAVKALFEVLAGPVGQPRTPGVCWRGLRTVSFDGCSSIQAPDSARNRAWLGAMGNAGYPHLMLMSLVETGTRAVLGAVFGSMAQGEVTYARQLVHLLGPGMLVLWDRGFDANTFLGEVLGTKAHFLGRVKSNRRLPVITALADGSYLTRIGDHHLRVIEAMVAVTCADGTRYTSSYRLISSLLDPRAYPAEAIVQLYHERWEHESAYYALRHTLGQRRILRSQDPVGLHQEMWALLTLYQILRTAMVEAVESRPGTDPDRACFTTALQTARDQVITATNIIPENPCTPGDIASAVLTSLLPPRRPRVSVRKVKSPLRRYASRREDPRPTTSQTITTLAIITPAITLTHSPRSRQRKTTDLTPAASP